MTVRHCQLDDLQAVWRPHLAGALAHLVFLWATFDPHRVHIDDEDRHAAIAGTCDAALGDAHCVIDLDDPAYSGAGVVVDPVRDRVFTASGLRRFVNGWFAFGHLEWTAGPNAGRAAEIMLHELALSVVTITCWKRPFAPWSAGDIRPLSAFSRMTWSASSPLDAWVVGFEADLQPQKAPPQIMHIWLDEAVSAEEQHRRGLCLRRSST